MLFTYHLCCSPTIYAVHLPSFSCVRVLVLLPSLSIPVVDPESLTEYLGKGLGNTILHCMKGIELNQKHK